MIYWFRELPEIERNRIIGWKPFIKNVTIRKNYMIFVYFLISIFIVISNLLNIWSFKSFIFQAFLFIIIFILHELVHIITIYQKGDMSITHSGIFFWLTPDAILKKTDFLLFMSLPVLLLSGLPFVISIVINNETAELLKLIGWSNLIISASDIINSVIIILKPRKSFFYRGFYNVCDD